MSDQIEKRKQKRKRHIIEVVKKEEKVPAEVKLEDVDEEEKRLPPPVKKERWTNRHRVLVFASRGITFRLRHLMNDLRTMLPHAKGETKMEKKERLETINEICEMRNCQVCVYFEMKKHQDAFMWIASTPNGPSVKFSLENVHTMQELRMTGNCLKGSRPILAFGKEFETTPHWRLIRELLAQVFNSPNHHPKSQPFIDHVLSISIADGRIWFRSYQIIDEGKASLTEIGPRFTANPMAIFAGSFGGPSIWQNPDYVSPAIYRRFLKLKKSTKYQQRHETKLGQKERLETQEESYDLDPTDALFATPKEKKPQNKKKIEATST